MVKTFCSLFAVVIASLLVTSCINASTAFAWRSVSYQVTPEAGQYVTVDEKQGAATVNAEKTLTDAFKESASVPAEVNKNGE